MDDTNIFGSHTSNTPDCWISNTMITSHDQRNTPSRRDMCNSIRDLIEGLFNIGWDGKNITYVTKSHLLTKIDTFFIIVGSIQCTDPSDTLRPESCSRTIRAASIKGNTNDSDIKVFDFASILDEWSL